MIKTVLYLLYYILGKALEDNFVRRNPAKGVRTASNKPKNDRRVLTTEDQNTFFDCSSGTFYNNLFVVAVNTGLRPGELFALTWNDVDLQNRTISVTKTLVYQKYLDDDSKNFHLEPPKTKQSERLVPINSICAKALKRQYMQKNVVARNNPKETAFSDLLFTTKYNTPLNSVLYSGAIDKIVAEINLMRDSMDSFETFSGHTFRHTFATRCIESGINPKTLQSYLGHATIQMTMDLYVHSTNETKMKEITLLENELNRISSNVLREERMYDEESNKK